MMGLLDGLMLDICLRFLRLRFRLVYIAVEDGEKARPGVRYGLRAGPTTCGGAEVVSRALRGMADDLDTQAETAIIITRVEQGNPI